MVLGYRQIIMNISFYEVFGMFLVRSSVSVLEQSVLIRRTKSHNYLE